jgi:hypothetical protein
MSGVAAAGLLAAGCTGSSGNSAAGTTGSAGPSLGSATAPPTGTSPTPSTTPTTTPASGGISPSGTPGTPAPPGAPAVYRLGPRDSGKQVVLRIGDRLEVTLAGNRLTALWTLTGYPRDALRLELRQATFGRFVFVARARGGGNVTFVRAQCGVAPDRPCVDGPAPGDPLPKTPAPGATRTFTVPVRVG